MAKASVSLPEITPEVAQRFWSRVHIDNQGCWIFHDPCASNIYGRFSVKGYPYPANRLGYKIYYGQDPTGMYVCHSCDVPRCVNPFHLFLGTQRDNMDDMVRKGRNGRKLNWEQVRQIRAKWRNGTSYAEISAQYNIGSSMIGNIVANRQWVIDESTTRS